jgi:TnsA endonuclease N terminal
MSYLDSHPDVISWASEEFSIPYVSPLDNRIHRYFPDFWVKMKTRDGKITTVVIEIKPHHQTIEPKAQKSKSKKYVREVATWGINSAKWKAAKDFCADRKWDFKILNEHDLGLK